MTTNRTWLAFANENICNHRKVLKELGFVSWTTNKHIENMSDEFYYDDTPGDGSDAW